MGETSARQADISARPKNGICIESGHTCGQSPIKMITWKVSAGIAESKFQPGLI